MLHGSVHGEISEPGLFGLSLKTPECYGWIPPSMNKHYSLIAVFLLVVTMLVGCPSTNMKTVEVSSLVPAEITLPSDIANLLIIDRTVYTGNPFESNEAIMTGEVSGEDREAVETLMFFLQRYLGGSPRFQAVSASETLSGNSFSGEFPRPIPWDTVRDLCRRYQTDVLVAIEVYRSDFNVSNPRRASAAQQSMLEDPQYSQDPQQPQYRPQSLYSVRGTGNIIFGFRIYDPRTETIVDEQLFRHNETWDATGPDPAQTMTNLIRRERAIGELIHLAGAQYSGRIAPILVPVTRSYFGQSGNTAAMAAGAELAEAGQWQEAADIWEAGISQAPKREAGQLAYNIAIAYEVLGQTEQAQEWAKKANEEYGNQQARAYLSGLEEKRTLEIRAAGQMQ